MFEHGHELINGVLLAGMTRGAAQDASVPVWLRWIGRFVLPVVPLAIGLYISVQMAIGHIADNKQSISDNKAEIAKLRERQDKTIDDISKRIDAVQTMLAIAISKK